LDETLPDTLHMTGIYLMILLTSLAIVTTSIYYYAIMTGALILAFFMMQVRAAATLTSDICQHCCQHLASLHILSWLKSYAAHVQA
jgi:hypothetical protein